MLKGSLMDVQGPIQFGGHITVLEHQPFSGLEFMSPADRNTSLVELNRNRIDRTGAIRRNRGLALNNFERIVEDRYQAGSTLIASQLPIDTWHDVIGEPTFADAILNRIVHNSHRIALDGQSLRKTKTGDDHNEN